MIWLDGQTIFGFTVEKHEIPRLGGASYYPMPISTGLGGLHTTEGNSLKGAIAAMEAGLKKHQPSDACHFICGEGRIVQTRPVGVQAASMRDPANRRLYVQIENVGFSQQRPWRLDDSTRKPLVALLAYCATNFDIPLEVPLNFSDDCSDIKGAIWATASCARRKKMEAIWSTAKGWILHLEAPWNIHWDCGAVDRSVMLKEAELLING